MDGEEETIALVGAANQDKVSAEPWNTTLNYDLENLPLDSNFAWLLCALLFAMSWVIYITFYNSRVIGYLVTKIANRFMPPSTYVKIGSISISVLSGTIMFRDLIYMTMDYTVRIQDGWLVFRWWRTYHPRDLTKDLSQSDTRLSLLLNGFEFHMYNRTDIYAKLAKIFGLDSKISQTNKKTDSVTSLQDLASSSYGYLDWHDLIPVIKVEMNVGRFVFGNHLVPTTLITSFEEAAIMYTIKPAQSKLDLFTHIAKCKAENAKVLLAPSPKYTGMVDDPPRYMGEGFVVLQSNHVDVYYYMDEPGLVTGEPEVIQLANGDIIERNTVPCWGVDIKCGKGTDFSYGPWADRQREQLFKFFFPQDYQPMEITHIPTVGERRVVQSFDIRLSTLSDATIDILFSKEKVTNAVHINIGPGSYLESTIPWIITEKGYSTRVNGQLLHVDGSTSLQYRSLLETETLEFDVNVNYPLIWNSHQDWKCTLTACKSTLSLIYAHKQFFQEMINDWGSKARPDMYHFVPYTWNFNLIIKEFELITIANDHNWIDCSSQYQENAQLAFCGEIFDLSFSLPFIDFLPPTIPIKFWIQAESVDLSMYIPTVNNAHNIIKSLNENAKLMGRDGKIWQPNVEDKKWRNVAKASNGWIECWSVPIFALSITYTYHPMAPTKKIFGAKQNFTTPEKEEILLAPIRPDPSKTRIAVTPDDFDPTVLAADLINVELEIGPSFIKLYGSLLHYFMNVKENYFGENQSFVDFEETDVNSKLKHHRDLEKDVMKNFDPRTYRPFEVTLSVTLHEIQGHVMKDCNEKDPPCPVIYLERLGFEMHKAYRETKLQLLLSPLVLHVVDNNLRPLDQKALNNGHLLLSGLQMKGHAMFSDEGRSLDSETLEYAWLVDVQTGDLTGRLTPPQLHNVFIGIQTMVLLAEEPGSELHNPKSSTLCQHDVLQEECSKSIDENRMCPSVDDIKYRMTRLSINKINVDLVESSTCMNIIASPLRFSTCNLHGKKSQNGFTFMVHDLILRKFIEKPSADPFPAEYNLNESGETILNPEAEKIGNWLEVGVVTLGPILFETSIHNNRKFLSSPQSSFLEAHDTKTKRLWFLWKLEDIRNYHVPSKVYGKCGCLGGCYFFSKKEENWSQFFFESSSDSSDSIVNMNCWPSLLQKESSQQSTSIIDQKHYFHPNHGFMENNVLRNRKKGTTLSAEALAPLPSSNKVLRQHSCDSKFHHENYHAKGSITRPPSLHSNISFDEHKDTSKCFGLRKQLKSTGVDNLTVSTAVLSSSHVGDSSSASSTLVRTSDHSPKPSLTNTPVFDDKGPNESFMSSQKKLSQSKQSIYHGQKPTLRRDSFHSSDTFFSADEEDDENKTKGLPSVRKELESKKIKNAMNANKARKRRQSYSSLKSFEDTKLLLDSEKHKFDVNKPHNPRESDSTSISSASFMSAVSSQDDIAMVDLHTQMNKSISDSPLLLSCYNNHLSQVSCADWQSLPPLPYLMQPDKNQNHKPSFTYISQGFTSIQMEDKAHYSKFSSRTPLSATSQFTTTHSDFTPIHDFSEFFDTLIDAEEDELCNASDSSNTSQRSIVVIKLLNQVDIYFCPILLEFLQRMIDAMTPVVSTIHPISIINGMFLGCSKSVKQQNFLKREKFNHPDKLKQLLFNNDSSLQSANKHTEDRIDLMQICVSIPQININIIQTAIVEEIISFSALDNMPDLTCPSLFSISLHRSTVKMFSHQSIQQTIQIFENESPPVGKMGTPFIPFRRSASHNMKKPQNDSTIDPFCVETVDRKNLDFVCSLTIDKLHAQIRRLCNSSNLLKDANLTDIPSHRSKVMFTLHGCGYHDKATELSHIEKDQIGFIMFECGLESIRLKLLKSVGIGNREVDDENSKFMDASDLKSEKPSHAESSKFINDPDKESRYSSEGENRSWTSRISIPSQNSECDNEYDRLSEISVQNIDRNTLSGIIKLKTVWFNFAAPPKSPNTRKIDFTRMDMHLLSTVSPALNAWLNPFEHLKQSGQKMLNEMRSRQCAIIACIMIEALEAHDIHVPSKRKYQRITPLAKSILDDPSCQLLVVLSRYILEKDITEFSLQRKLDQTHIPHLETLHRGIMAVSRQWKNILYIPKLVEQNFRSKKPILKPMNVSCGPSFLKSTSPFSVDEESIDETEATDENSRLLKNGESALSKIDENASNSIGKEDEYPASPESPGIPSAESRQDLTNDSENKVFKKKKLPSYIPRLSRASIAFPLFNNSESNDKRIGDAISSMFVRSAAGFNRFFRRSHSTSTGQQYQHVPCKIKQKEESTPSVKSLGSWSVSSVSNDFPNTQHDLPSSSAGGTPFHQRQSTDQQGSIVFGDQNEDLYKWMVREQEKFPNNLENNPKVTIVTNPDPFYESNITTLTSDHSKEDEMYPDMSSNMIIPAQVIQLADANVIFHSLLLELGVSSSESCSLNAACISLSTAIDLMKVDIIESESNITVHKKKRQRKDKGLICNANSDQASFLCDKLSFEIEIRDILNFEEKYSRKNYVKKSFIKHPLFYGANKKITTVINFDINAHFMAQQVNMPLLRLIHQFSTMYENAKETQLELKEKRINLKGTHRKTESSSSESQTDSSRLHQHYLETNSALNQNPLSLSPKNNGYMNIDESSVGKLSERGNSPISLEISDCITIKIPSENMDDVDEPEKKDEKKENNCWRTMYHLLDLYDTMPDLKTVHNSPNADGSLLEKIGFSSKSEYIKEHRINIDCVDTPEVSSNFKGIKSSYQIAQDHVALVVFGLVKVKKTRLLATLSGLKLEAELENFHVSATHKEMTKFHLYGKNTSGKKWFDSSATGNLGKSMVILLEGIPPTQQTVVKMNVGKSQALYSSMTRKKSCKDRNSTLLSIGPIQIDIPQHPVILHGMMTRGTKQLSSTLQELRATTSRQPLRSRLDESLGTSESLHSPKQSTSNFETHSYLSEANRRNSNAMPPQSALIQPIVIHFNVVLESFTVGAALLPSLTAKYQMGQITSVGFTGNKAKFTIDLPKHSLSFNTKVISSETNLPSSAIVDLPPVHVSAEYIQNPSEKLDQNLMDGGVVLRQGSYLNANADIGSFEHSLTTDLLNHLVFVQKVFMKEVNEVVQKVSGADRPIFSWPEHEDDKVTSPSSPVLAPLLFSLQLKLQGIQITAMTPTNSAVRFETGSVEFQLSNRVLNMSRGSKSRNNNFVKLFGKVQLDMNLALGQLTKNAVFEEAEPDFQQFAYFKTHITMRNALQDEMVASQSYDKEAVLITLNRPLIHVQPIALDKAILVWLNYKNAYEYWNEQRANLNKEVLTATQQVFEKVPQFTPLNANQTVSTLFLQLTIDDLGICLPLNPYTGVLNYNSRMLDSELKSALVVTLDSTRISACSCKSLVSKGKFTDLCLRFTDDFETSLDDWKPDPNDSNMNLFVVSEGTYEICSRTVAPVSSENAKWILNVQWQMEGVDIHVDTNIGKQLNSLFNTLTALTGDDLSDAEAAASSKMAGSYEQTTPYKSGGSSSNRDSSAAKPIIKDVALPLFVFDPIVDAKKRSRLIEKEMNEQAKIVNDLKLLGASQNTIEQEHKRLLELESLVFNDFRRDMIKKLRRQSVKQASSIRGKFGLGSDSSPSHSRSKSIVIPENFPLHSPTKDLSIIGSSNDSSPSHGHIRAASLDTAHMHRVTFGKVSNVLSECRSPDMPSIPSENSSDFIPSISQSSSASSEINKNASSGNPKISQEGIPSHANGRPTTSASVKSVFPAEPCVDFELDIKVFINSGKCVFHSKDSNKEDDTLGKGRSLRKDRSYSGSTNLDFPLSPNHKKRGLMGLTSGGYLKTNLSSSKLKYLHIPQQSQTSDCSVFLIPGLDVKIHYKSKTDVIDSSSDSKRSDKIASKTNKKASLYAWLTLQSIPEETVITPHILDFLENALEPIPIPSFSVSSKPNVSHNQQTSQDTNTSGVFGKLDLDSTSTSMSMPVPNTTSSSFPVDVVVYFRMQPSVLRFSCLPISRVECWLRLPSVDLIFSSKRADDDSQLKDESRQKIFVENSGITGLYSGGISVTACLSDFSLNIFHPYGGSKKGGPGGPKLYGGFESSPLSDLERKDSLSVQVEFVKVNISRSRKVNPVFSDIKGSDSVKNVDVPGGAFVNVSTIVDIGSAFFKYDMRKLTEILAFPKAWYRKKIARRIFLGDQSSGAVFSDQDDSGPDESRSMTSTLSPDTSSTKPSDVFTFQSSSSSFAPLSNVTSESQCSSMNQSKVSPSKNFSSQSLRDSIEDSSVDIDRTTDQKSSSENANTSNEESSIHNINVNKPIWETLLRFTVNLAKLDVQMNMGNVMGNTTWSTRGVMSEGHLSISSSGHKDIAISVGLSGSSIDAKGGIVGGTFDLSVVDAFLHLKEDPGQEPVHIVQVKLYALESRLDYMGTSVLMLRFSSLNVMMKDEWRVNIDTNKFESCLPTKRPAVVFVHCDLNWDQFQLMISRSTNTDILKTYNKLEEFFSQQFHSSKRVFSSLQPHRSSVKKKSSFNENNKPNPTAAPSHEAEASHHRHWQNVLAYISGLQIGNLCNPLPAHGTIVGGTVDLHGENISLACFHGINFRAKSWALFSLKEPNISFATEAQDICDDGPIDTHIIQNLAFSFGHSSTGEATVHSTMATICKISRTVVFPPQFKTMQEWFHYAFATSELDDVSRFPSLERRDSVSSMDRRVSASPKGSDHNHSMEMIFAFPSLQLQLKTEHLQTESIPKITEEDNKPFVECSFVTEFDDHIFVAVDAEAFFFLHDLINSYIKDKDKSYKSQPSKNQSPDVQKLRKVRDPLHMLSLDWRDFKCKTWHLEPTVRLLSWAGKRIDPYGVDYILQKLGFTHARTTIPKWMQRGFMDPMDKILSILMYKMIKTMKDEKVENE